MVKNYGWLRIPVIIVSILLLLAVFGWTIDPPTFDTGQKLTANKLNQIRDSINELRDQVGEGGGGITCSWQGTRKMVSVKEVKECYGCCGIMQECKDGEQCTNEKLSTFRVNCQDGQVTNIQMDEDWTGCYCDNEMETNQCETVEINI